MADTTAERPHKATANSFLSTGDAQDDLGKAHALFASAQAHATLALVEATERLAEAQETANLIARQVWATNVALAVGSMTPEILEAGKKALEEIARRLSGYHS